jgi:fatty-acyl-CoA synthase
VKFDVVSEDPVRGSDGYCIPAALDEPGELLGKIDDKGPSDFSGYHDKAATEKKILRDVFEKGDAWFRSGDLMSKDKAGYIYFNDRIGDTFRWKGENVATNEVAEALSQYPGINTANVYGVAIPGTDGKAGMASLTIGEGFEIADLHAYLSQNLPPYAIPVFLRQQPEAETTGTFKYRKVDLVKDGFDVGQIEDQIWFSSSSAKAYQPLNTDQHEAILAGKVQF